MSRHLLIDRPDFRLVVGFDHMLRSFFGQVFDPSKDDGIAIAGWPTSSGLGTRRPAGDHDMAARDIKLLMDWACSQARSSDLAAAGAGEHFHRIARILSFEWSEGEDDAAVQVPVALQGARS